MEEVVQGKTDHMVRTVGKTLAYTSIRFMDGKGELVARGSHTK